MIAGADWWPAADLPLSELPERAPVDSLAAPEVPDHHAPDAAYYWWEPLSAVEVSSQEELHQAGQTDWGYWQSEAGQVHAEYMPQDAPSIEEIAAHSDGPSGVIEGASWEQQGQTVDVGHVLLTDRDPIAIPEIDRADRDAWDAHADRGPDERTDEERAADVAALEGPLYTFDLGEQERER